MFLMEVMIMGNLTEYLPFLIPLVLVELGLFVYALVHILKHDHYKTGNRTMWLIVIILLMNLIGPILYLILGREED